MSDESEYEAVLTRPEHLGAAGITAKDVSTILATETTGCGR